MTNQEIADKLDAIGAELEAHPERWCQGRLAIDASGKGLSARDTRAVAWCAIGWLDRFRIFDWTFFEVAISAPMIHLWNNAPGRTAAEVAAAFHRAAQLAREATHA